MTRGKITLYVATSVDGFVATDDGGVSWLDAFEEESGDEAGDGDDTGGFAEFFDGVDCLVVGSRTYEQVLTFGDWPYDEKPTFVLTRRELPRANDSVRFFAGAVNDLTADLRDRYEHVWLVGGADVARQFLRSNGIDELWLSVVPRLLESGIPLFDDSGVGHQLDLIESTSHTNGIVELRYDVQTD